MELAHQPDKSMMKNYTTQKQKLFENGWQQIQQKMWKYFFSGIPEKGSTSLKKTEEEYLITPPGNDINSLVCSTSTPKRIPRRRRKRISISCFNLSIHQLSIKNILWKGRMRKNWCNFQIDHLDLFVCGSQDIFFAIHARKWQTQQQLYSPKWHSLLL